MKRKMVREPLGEDVYEYYPLGKYIVSAPRVCGGRPTFKYTRIEVAGVLWLLSSGRSPDQLVESYHNRFSHEALEEAAALAGKALVRQVREETPRNDRTRRTTART